MYDNQINSVHASHFSLIPLLYIVYNIRLCMLYYTHLFTCIGTQMFKGCVGHLLQHFMPARVFVVSEY